MKEELRFIEKHKVWSLCDLPKERKAVNCKWVFKTKLDDDGQIYARKARFVARGFLQRFGEDYDSTFAPVVKHETIRALLVIAAQKKMHVRQLDVKSAYLNGELENEIYMNNLQASKKQVMKQKC